MPFSWQIYHRLMRISTWKAEFLKITVSKTGTTGESKFGRKKPLPYCALIIISATAVFRDAFKRWKGPYFSPQVTSLKPEKLHCWKSIASLKWNKHHLPQIHLPACWYGAWCFSPCPSQGFLSFLCKIMQLYPPHFVMWKMYLGLIIYPVKTHFTPGRWLLAGTISHFLATSRPIGTICCTV